MHSNGAEKGTLCKSGEAKNIHTGKFFVFIQNIFEVEPSNSSTLCMLKSRKKIADFLDIKSKVVLVNLI